MHFFENIFPLIVIYVIWRIFVRAQKSVPKEGTQQKEQNVAADGAVQPAINLRELLLGVLTGQMDSSGQAVPRPQSPVRDGEPREAGYWQGYDQDWQEPPPVVESSAATARLAAKEKKIMSAASRPDAVAASSLPPARPQAKRFCKSRRELQDAVVWAEILAKPVALRDQQYPW